jgi:hypothetical protein
MASSDRAEPEQQRRELALAAARVRGDHHRRSTLESTTGCRASVATEMSQLARKGAMSGYER